MLRRALLLVLAAASVAFPQRGGGGGGGRGGGGGMSDMPMMRPQRQSRLQLFAEKLKLSKEQREEAEKILTAAMHQAAPLAMQIDKSRAEIAGSIIDGKPEGEIQKLKEAHTALEAQMDTLEADTFAKIYAELKPNQQSKAGEAFELMAGVFDRAASGGGGARGPRGGR
jgi:cell division protein FtsB